MWMYPPGSGGNRVTTSPSTAPSIAKLAFAVFTAVSLAFCSNSPLRGAYSFSMSALRILLTMATAVCTSSFSSGIGTPGAAFMTLPSTLPMSALP